MTQPHTTPSLSPAFWQIVGGCMLLWVPGVLSGVIGRRLGLEVLEWGAAVSAGLSALSIGLLWAFSGDVRQTVRDISVEFRTKVSRRWIFLLVIGNVLLVALVYLYYKLQLIPDQVGNDVGWKHYFSLTQERRPDFLLHYLWLQAVDMVLLAPIAEELLHIGVIVGVLRRYSFPVPWICSFNAVLFVIFHFSHGIPPDGIKAAVMYALARIFLDTLFLHTRNIAVPIIAHMLNNLRVLSLNWFPLLP